MKRLSEADWDQVFDFIGLLSVMFVIVTLAWIIF